MTCHTGENRVDGGFDADMWYIVELGNDTVPVVGSCEASGPVHLWAGRKTAGWSRWMRMEQTRISKFSIIS